MLVVESHSKVGDGVHPLWQPGHLRKSSIERGFVMHERGTGDATSEVRPEWVHELEVGIAAELVFPFAIVPCCWEDRAEHHTIFVENPVVGKSTLLNALLSPIVGVFKSPDLKSAVVLPN